MQEKGFQKAIPIMEEALKANPDSIKPYMAMAGIYLANNDTASAERIYKKAIAAKSDAIEPRTALANLYFKRGKDKGFRK